MKSKALLTGSLTILLLGGILAEYTPGVNPPDVSPPAKKNTAAVSRPVIPAPASAGPASKRPANDPLGFRDEGYRQIAALQSTDQFEHAAEFATAGPAEVRRDWIIAAYHEWSRRQPELAFASATKIQDPTSRETALQSVFSGWARTDPQGLAELAFSRPEGPEKDAALTKAVRAWIQQDPEKASDWIVAHESVVPLVNAMVQHDRR